MALGKKTGGRVRGTPNKATADIKAAAAIHGPLAISVLAEIAIDSENAAAARVAAAVALLDRGFGKPAQALTGADGGPIQSVAIKATKAEFKAIAAAMVREV